MEFLSRMNQGGATFGVNYWVVGAPKIYIELDSGWVSISSGTNIQIKGDFLQILSKPSLALSIYQNTICLI